MKSRIRLVLAVSMAVLLATAQSVVGQVRITEVAYADADFGGSSMWVELYNPGDEAVDVSSYWLCNFPDYQQISDLAVLAGETTIEAGGLLVVEYDGLGVDDGEVGLYSSDSFESSDAIVDYMQYGSADHMRETLAVEAGVWATGSFVEAAGEGQTLALVGATGEAAENWSSAAPTPGSGNPMDPSLAVATTIDRFAEGTGTLFVRTEENDFPEAGEPIDFDQAPFITRGLAPDGRSVQYYNFDVMPQQTAPIYALFREGEEAPVDGQLNIVGVVPGDEGYNDFWQVHRVTVAADYEANTVTSVEALVDAGYTIEPLNVIVNCPIVPAASTAELRYTEGNDAGLVSGWYGGEVIYYFDFSEKMLTVELPEEGPALLPASPIYVAFNINPGEDGGGPPSGFMSEEGSDQTHNVVATLPEDDAYSPLWSVNPYDNADFGDVHDLASAEAANILDTGVALVNCPIVSIMTDTAIERLPDEVPEQFELHGNYPNPFNPETTIRYALNESGSVSLRVFDLLGRSVVDLVDANQTSGVYQVTWDGRDARGSRVATGIYLYRLSLNGRISEARTMTVIK